MLPVVLIFTSINAGSWFLNACKASAVAFESRFYSLSQNIGLLKPLMI